MPLLDRVLEGVDISLRTLLPKTKATPLTSSEDKDCSLTQDEKQCAIEMMRVNHAGEVCAQALYYGQALTARKPHLKTHLMQSAKEEQMHLNWTSERLKALGGRTSYLNPVWFLGSLTLGAIAGLAGDKWSLGFLAETEQQVTKHLEEHLSKLSDNDTITRNVLKKMQADEIEHTHKALELGGVELPTFIKLAMTCTAKIMTRTTRMI